MGLSLAERAWVDAQRHTLDNGLWSRLVAAREHDDPESVIPVLRDLIESDLTVSDARNYKSAAKRLKQLKVALRTLGRENEFDGILSDLRTEHRRRPRLLEELRKAGF